MGRMRDVYTPGHHESVLRSHRWRTADNSAGYLLPELKPGMRVLDVGCGPGTITADLADRVPDGHVTGIDADAIVDAGARALMVNAFLAGLGSIGRLRAYGLPLFVHRVGSAFLRRGGRVSVSARVLAELTQLLGADYVQVGSFSNSANALRLGNRLSQFFPDVRVDRLSVDGHPYYRVRMGAFPDHAAARERATQTARLGLPAIIEQQ